MAEDDRPDEKGAASGTGEGGGDIHLRGGGVQPGADAESGGQTGWCRMSPGRSVPGRGQSGPKGPRIEALRYLQCNLGAICLQFGIMQVADLARNRLFSAAC